MKLEYYPIRGRGDNGDCFQLARLSDENGENYKGRYDQARHFTSEQDLKDYLAGLVNVDASSIELSKMAL